MRVNRFVVVLLLASLTLAETSAPAMTDSRRHASIAARMRMSSAPRRASRTRMGATTCSADATTSFVGISGASNIAGGSESAVLGGQNNEACDPSTVVFGGEANAIGNNGEASYSFVGAGTTNSIGAREAAIGAGAANAVTGDYAFIGAGALNAAADDAFVASGMGGKANGTASFVGAGGSLADQSCTGCPYFNEASGIDAFVGAGDLNLASGNGSFVGGGGYSVAGIQHAMVPSNQAAGEDSFVGAGDANVASGAMAFIGAGKANAISTAGTAATILGGSQNTANGAESTIGGGYGNSAAGEYATVPGGYGNEATGELSFAAGYHAGAGHNGSFVWSDYVSGSKVFADSAAEQFLVRASGGVSIYSNEAATSGVRLAAGSGTWANLSDRASKTSIAALDEKSVLAGVASLQVGEWRYRTERSVRHVGPMAQDFYAAFGIGEDDRHIATIDEGGIALAAAAALHRDDEALARENERLIAQNERAAQNVAKAGALLARVAGWRDQLSAQSAALRSPKRRSGVTSCTTSGSPSFVGVMSEGNDAGATYSAVLGGQENTACDKSDAIGDGLENEIGSDGEAFDSFIGGGGHNALAGAEAFIGAGAQNGIDTVSGQDFIGAGTANSTTSGDSAVVSGVSNIASGNAAFVGAGGFELISASKNTANANNIASGQDAFVGAGDLNRASGNGSFIGAGGYMQAASKSVSAGNQVSGTDAFVGAGDENVSAADQSFIGAGQSNTIVSGATGAVIAGGTKNTDSGAQSTLAGGYGNTVSGEYATVLAGYGNVAKGELSFAAGYHATAAHDGSFVWSDYRSGSTSVEDTAINQFVVRASGGVSIYSNEAATAGVRLAAGSGAWSSLSDRNAKTDEEPLDGRAMLADLSKLEIDRWQYRTEPGATHIGPMAQDFYAAFGVGEDARHITSIDENGITLATIGALDRSHRALRMAHDRWRARDANLEATSARLVAGAASAVARFEALRAEAALLADRARLTAISKEPAQ